MCVFLQLLMLSQFINYQVLSLAFIHFSQYRPLLSVIGANHIGEIAFISPTIRTTFVCSMFSTIWSTFVLYSTNVMFGEMQHPNMTNFLKSTLRKHAIFLFQILIPTSLFWSGTHVCLVALLLFGSSMSNFSLIFCFASITSCTARALPAIYL